MDKNQNFFEPRIEPSEVQSFESLLTACDCEYEEEKVKKRIMQEAFECDNIITFINNINAFPVIKVKRVRKHLALRLKFVDTKKIENVGEQMAACLNILKKYAKLNCIGCEYEKSEVIRFDFSLSCFNRLCDRSEYRECFLSTLQILDSIIEALFLKNWKLSDKIKIYDQVKKMITDWYDFFLSYTGRAKDDINKSYLNISERFKHKYDVLDDHVIVKAVYYRLCETCGLSGFIQEPENSMGDIFTDRIQDALSKSHTFLQVIEPKCFDQGAWPPKEFNEYQRYNRESGLCMALVLRKKFVDVRINDQQYTLDSAQWLNFLNQNGNLSIKEECSPEEFDEIMIKYARKILNHRNKWLSHQIERLSN